MFTLSGQDTLTGRVAYQPDQMRRPYTSRTPWLRFQTALSRGVSVSYVTQFHHTIRPARLRTRHTDGMHLLRFGKGLGWGASFKGQMPSRALCCHAPDWQLVTFGKSAQSHPSCLSTTAVDESRAGTDVLPSRAPRRIRHNPYWRRSNGSVAAGSRRLRIVLNLMSTWLFRIFPSAKRPDETVSTA